MRKFVTPLFFILLGIAVLVGAAFVLNRPSIATAPIAPTMAPLTLNLPTPSNSAPIAQVSAKSANAAATNRVRAVGNLISASQANLAFLGAGRIKEIKVKEGDRVKAGAILALLDTSLLDLQVAQAQAALDLAKASFDKIKAGPTEDDVTIAKSNVDRAKAALDQAQAVYDRVGGSNNALIGLLPQSLALQQAYSTYGAAVSQYNLTIKHPTDTELRVAQAQMAQAKATFDLAKQNVTNASLVAPFDGTIVSIGAKIGEMASPSVPAIQLADLSRMQVQVNLDENTLALVRAGQTVSLSLDALGDRRLTGRVSKTGLVAATASGIVSVPATIDIDPTDAAIYPGLSAMVEFQTAQ